MDEEREQLLVTVDPGNNERARSSDQEPGSAVSRRHCIFKLIFAVTIVAMLATCLSFIICMTPIPPIIHVNSMQISFLTSNNNTVPIWQATFSIRNPNEKLRITYENASVTVFHRRKLVWSERIRSFGQKGETEDEVFVEGGTENVRDVAARAIEEDVIVNGGVVRFDISFEGRLGFCPGSSFLWGEQDMTALCKDVRALFYEKMDRTRRVVVLQGSRECSVRLPMFS